MTAFSIEQILAEDAHVVAIHPPRYEQMPQVDVTLFDPLRKDRVERMFQIVATYLSYPLIEDDFGSDHEARWEWRKSMQQTYGDRFQQYYQCNKLKGNSFGYTLNALRFVSTTILGEKKKEITKKIIELATSFPDTYNDLATVDKIKTIRDVEEKIYGIVTDLQGRDL